MINGVRRGWGTGAWRLTAGVFAMLLALAAVAPGSAQEGDTATVEVRVWQDVEDSASIFISARPADGDWRILGTIPLPLDDGFSSSGTYRFGDISLDVPVPREPVSTLAGVAGALGFSDGQGDSARFGAYAIFSQHHPWALGLAAAPDGSVVVADFYNDAIRRVTPDGTVTTIASGRGFQDGEAEDARFYHPRGVAVDGRGTIYVADERNHRIRTSAPTGW